MLKAIAVLSIFGVAAAIVYAMPTAADTSTSSGDSGDNTVAPDLNRVPAPPPETPRDLTSKVIQFAASIAEAEGFFVSGSVPQRFHNPGDLGPGDTGFPGEVHDGSNVSKLPDDITGWNFLYKKVSRMLQGQSATFPINFTFKQVAQKYAARWQPWLDTQKRNLGVSDTTTLADYVRM